MFYGIQDFSIALIIKFYKKFQKIKIKIVINLHQIGT